MRFCLFVHQNNSPTSRLSFRLLVSVFLKRVICNKNLKRFSSKVNTKFIVRRVNLIKTSFFTFAARLCLVESWDF